MPAFFLMSSINSSKMDQERKEEREEGKKEERKEGRHAGREEGREEGREGLKILPLCKLNKKTGRAAHLALLCQRRLR